MDTRRVVLLRIQISIVNIVRIIVIVILSIFCAPVVVHSESTNDFNKYTALCKRYFAHKDLTLAYNYGIKSLAIKETPSILTILGAIETNKNNYLIARKYLEKSEKLDNKKFATAFYLGVTYVQLKYLEKAKKQFMRAIELKKDNEQGYYNLSYVYRIQGYHEDEMNILKEAIKYAKDPYESYYSLGCMYRFGNNYTKALECFDETLKIKPDHLKALDNKASIFSAIAIDYENNNNLEKSNEYYYKAIESLKYIIKIKPKYKDIEYWIGYYYIKVNKPELAKYYLEESLKNNPNKKEAIGLLRKLNRNNTQYLIPLASVIITALLIFITLLIIKTKRST